jgi:hypothetical protein
VDLTGIAEFDSHSCGTPLTQPEVFHGMHLAVNRGNDFFAGQCAFPARFSEVDAE